MNADNNENLVVIKLKKPLDYNGVIYDEIKMDLENLKGKDAREIKNELARRKLGPVVPGAEILSEDYLLGLAAKACTDPIGSDGFEHLYIKDYNKVVSEVSAFLRV